ncbi:50S ribosomal protein L20 [candidate division WS6 bacterium RIFOXYD1_FULL_33_8]|uniref:Large ribosomal subunit protein bL20 n=2 Tax=Candidatus Dojkabacteria TaxID=74243 RepID=A0A0G0DHF0_9BACT|nr:MAG: LSU ribosomal protein L20P, large subunit ribosomal protein L20 [candidate division WS6 bacterium GW2011_GWE2_33_157]KKP43529.1 MAG: LSU ribosomal protein L20P, large subunit ribosomal protein L20 [candidate division WS6 bacterium GW2011_GWC1_33_20]KKP45126.1 MAG: LSU ribosomal protein L20P, large subunit ribosomal protein L20 [candidate division WS6 bacterium GW2011_GWF1_33_233]KKP54401.1 MAG: LSU ribosomal protein L20P, large subunit ribosomal protein L20 [candidate division WS6 bacter
MRVKGGTVRKRRHNKVIATTKGYRMTKSKLYKVAHEAMMHAGQYAYNDRQKRQGQIRRVWIQKINAACKNNGIQYKTLISGLKTKNIELNRKVLADMAVNNPEVFSFVVKSL